MSDAAAPPPGRLRRAGELLVRHEGLALTLNIVAGPGTEVAAAFTDGSPIGGTPESPLLLLRGTSKFAFFYRPAERQVVIVPIESLSRIVVRKPPKSAGS
jgi:hypothetical protein